ncbi:carbamoyltransferase HypF [Acidiphilium sp.]|uniref:carbamoyltransferase HypF n=1 Tax=Acidiphilium sp. TaxID=527 RepID=UPI0025881D94|nr:carbamoyltransferase HypF [Acidiphilium sp.]
MDAIAPERLRIALAGMVQGVGFRPFVCRLAQEIGITGFVQNDGAGVLIEAEGTAPALTCFLDRLTRDAPPHAVVTAQAATPLAACGGAGFTIAASAVAAGGSAVVMADLATCPKCLGEISDPADRRYRYPFTTCVACGPRYSVIEALPYDRVRTTLRRFPLCPACAAEYADPASRRFHAESICCGACGPALALWDASGVVLATREAALTGAAAALRSGKIVALKGLGGFQLLVDARNDAAVAALRARKRRPRKPFALMVADLDAARALAVISAAEHAALTAPAAPIVLLAPKPEAARALAPGLDPGVPCLGLMLPTTPLHHLLLQDLGFPVVATSGNLGGGPILADEHAALTGLSGVADLFLVHDRPIIGAVDDSVVRVIAGAMTVLRRARGYAPLPLAWPGVEAPILALGGQQKSAVATGFGGRIFLGPHGGDLDGAAARERFQQNAAHLCALHGLRPGRIACDRHPDYASTHHAETLGAPVIRVPHHLAHALSGMVDAGHDGPLLAVAWDGAGYGGDGTVWGGEFLAIAPPHWRRAAHLLPFRLPGGDAAAREPRRAALGALHALHGAAALAMTGLPPVASFAAAERRVLAAMLARGVASPLASSAGRLFDAIAALLDLCQHACFEGEAAMALEAAAAGAEAAPLPAPEVRGDRPLVVDWRPTLAALLAGRAAGRRLGPLAAGFHVALASAIVAVARRLEARHVLLTGGCFQNARLAEHTLAGLRAAGIVALRHRLVPPNDGGLAVGQIAFAAAPLIEENA